MEKEGGELGFEQRINHEETGYSERKIDLQVDKGKSNSSNVKGQPARIATQSVTGGSAPKKKKNGIIYAKERLK